MVGSRELLATGQQGDARAKVDARDRAAIERVLAGDRMAFREIVDRHAPNLQRLIGRLLGRTSLAEEATQEVLIRAWKSLGRFRGDASVRSWLYRIATNLCRDMRKRSSWKETTADDPSLFARAPDPSEYGMSPEQRVADRRALEALEVAIRTLPTAQREVVELHLVAGLSYAEAAVTLGVSVGALKVRVHRARERLAKALGEHLDNQGGLDGF